MCLTYAFDELSDDIVPVIGFQSLEIVIRLAFVPDLCDAAYTFRPSGIKHNIGIPSSDDPECENIVPSVFSDPFTYLILKHELRGVSGDFDLLLKI